MDNKKLMQILLRDAVEMERLISEIRESGTFDPFDMELLQTRIGGIRHLLEVACDMKETVRPVEEITKTTFMAETIPLQESKTEILPFPGEIQSKIRKERKPEKSSPAAEKTIPVSGPVLTKSEKPAVETFTGQVTIKEEKPGESHTGREEKHILAEKFTAGKSINDLLVEKSKIEGKFTLLPLDSLASGIGTNERFLFTRELFNGDMESFNETIRKLDAMQTIHEATGYLRENFTWEKSETSLRFIELIRRRFVK